MIDSPPRRLVHRRAFRPKATATPRRRRSASIHSRTLPKPAPRLGAELAIDPIRTVFTGVGEDPHPSEVLARFTKHGHRLGDLYDEMLERDTVLASMSEKRKRAVLGLPRFIVPADGTPASIEAADFCHQALARIPNFRVNLEHQLETSINQGIAFDEMLWARLSRDEYVPIEIIDRPLSRFAFKQGRLHVRQVHAEPIAAPAGKFLCYRQGTKDSPWGRGLLDKAYWPWKLKRHGETYYSVFIERWAMPLPVGEVPDNAEDDEIDDMVELLQAIATDAVAVVRQSTNLRPFEATRSGSASYQDYIRMMDHAYALLYHCEDETSGSAKGHGSFARSKVSNQVRLETLRIDCRDLCAHICDQLLTPIVQLNLGPDVPVPKMMIYADEADDRKIRQGGVESVLSMGLGVPTRHIYEVHQVPRPRDGETDVHYRSVPKEDAA